MANIEDPAVQILILARVKWSVAPLCGALRSSALRDKARKIYDIAKQLEDEIKAANPVA